MIQPPQGRRVLPAGPMHAKIALVGESAGEMEAVEGRPFVGASGGMIESWWRVCGLMREEVYIDNLYPYLPPKKSMAHVNKADIESVWTPQLIRRLEKLPNLRVIVPTGNYAFKAVMGAAGLPGITDVRGSVYEVVVGGKRCLVVPTIHPAWFMRGMQHKQKRAILDWMKVVRLKDNLQDIEEILGSINMNIDPGVAKFSGFVRKVEEAGEACTLVCDIETDSVISCIGFAAASDEAWVIPTKPVAKREQYLHLIKRLLASDAKKVFQNGHYDTYWLRWNGIEVKNWAWDTLAMHHALDAADEHSLSYLCSIYVEGFQYWKSEVKDVKDKKTRAVDLNVLYAYNAKDVCYTFKLFTALYGELEAKGMIGFYRRHYSDLFEMILDVMFDGVRADKKAQKVSQQRMIDDCARLREELKEITGEEMYATKTKGRGEDKVTVLGKDFSRAKLMAFFYADRKAYTKVSKRKTGKVRAATIDKGALQKIALRVPKGKDAFDDALFAKAARIVLSHREKAKEVADFCKWDRDGRIRCTYSLNTEAGRFASYENPRRSGRNLQNVKRGKQRETYLPDEGHIFVAVDGSQVEDRIVKMYTRSRRMVELARLHPAEFDAHTYNASRIFGVSEAEVTKEQRYLGKRAVHAAQRGMRGDTLSLVLLRDGIEKPVKECNALLDAYLKDHHEIGEVYFPWVRERVLKDRTLVNSWGRRLTFHGDVRNNDTYKKAYSFYPQSECADWMNRGTLMLWRWLKRKGMKSRIRLFVHDEVVVSCPLDEAYGVAQYIGTVLEQQRRYFGEPLRIWCETSIGATWALPVEWKSLPDEGVFNHMARQVLLEAT